MAALDFPGQESQGTAWRNLGLGLTKRVEQPMTTQICNLGILSNVLSGVCIFRERIKGEKPITTLICNMTILG